MLQLSYILILQFTYFTAIRSSSNDWLIDIFSLYSKCLAQELHNLDQDVDIDKL